MVMDAEMALEAVEISVDIDECEIQYPLERSKVASN